MELELIAAWNPEKVGGWYPRCENILTLAADSQAVVALRGVCGPTFCADGTEYIRIEGYATNKSTCREGR